VSLCRRVRSSARERTEKVEKVISPFRLLLRFRFDILGAKSQGGWCKREKVEKVIFPFTLLLRSRFDILGGNKENLSCISLFIILDFLGAIGWSLVRACFIILGFLLAPRRESNQITRHKYH
jgi:hypothetical protein